MMVRFGVVGLALGALVLTACGRGLTPPEDPDSDVDTTDGDSDTLPDRGTEGTDDPGTEGTEDPGTDGTDDPGTDGTDGTDACIPDCTGQICGDDGCGGECGTCAGGSECSDAGDECVTTSTECRPVQIEDDLQAFALNAFFATDVTGTSELQGQFYSDATGTFSLDAGVNTNFATCEQCFLYLEDDTVFFQSAGAVNVADNPTDADVTFTLAGVQLVESTIDSTVDPPVSSPVVGGECIELASPLELAAPCSPMEVTSEWVLGEFNGFFFANLEPAFFRGDDVAQIVADFYSDDVGTFDLAAGTNSNYSSCEQCVTAVSQDETTQQIRQFYPTGGTITITGAAPSGSTLTATIENLTMEEVTIDADTFESTPVVGGQCLRGPASISIDVQAP